MSEILKWVAPIAIAAVAIVLIFGLINMMKGGNPNTSQKFMRWRVILQFIAVAILMLVLYVKSRT
jgi:glucan phosphoethanolaminetransferase (alkaline phosphatase superfamily)